jgi:ketosteroid isomerase-like protein
MGPLARLPLGCACAIQPFLQGDRAMTTLEIAKKYVALCKEGKNAECLDTLFAKDAVSVEAGAPPGMDRTAKGLEAIHAKSKWWGENHTVHEAQIDGPYPHDDRFAVRFNYDVTHKPSGRRFKMDEVGLFTVQKGKVAREEFFYTMG